MALYTELLADYINNGNELPTIFSQIEGFNDLFISHFLDCEIGFETEELFKLKLEKYAQIYIPLYKKRIERLTKAITNAEDPTKTYTDEGSAVASNGQQKGSVTDLPFNSAVAEPSQITSSEAFENKNTSKTTRTEKGVSVMEAYEVINKLNSKVFSLLLTLLDEFKPCFMGIYY